MNAEKFVKAVRSGNEKLRVDNVTVEAGPVKLRGRGILRIAADEPMRLDLTLTGRHRPLEHPRVITKRDAWKLSGLIENELPFKCENVSPGGNLRSANGLITITRSLHHLELVTERFDSARAIRRRKSLEKRIGLKLSKDPDDYAVDACFRFEATLVGCELPAWNGGTNTTRDNSFLGKSESVSSDTFVGELKDSRFALIEAENEIDLNVYLVAKEGVRSESEKADRKKFHAFLSAVSFVKGFHPWPFHRKYSRGGYDLSEVVTAARKLTRTDYAPFNRALGMHSPDGLVNAIRLSSEFFEADTAFARQVMHLLFLFREAGKQTVQGEIRILALSALLEGLLRTILEHRGSKRAAKKARSEELFKRVGEKLNIRWSEEMEPLYTEWKRARNPSAHGDFPAEMPANADELEEVKKFFFGMSRVAGGFNMILLKLFGYQGRYLASALEDKYQAM